MKTKSLILLILFSAVMAAAASNKLIQERAYEPVVMRSGSLYAFNDVPVNELFLYAYDADAGAWRMMPFQIDQRVRTEDPFKPGNEAAWRHTYFAEEDGLFDDEDELIFMVRDLGDQAPDNIWLEDAECRTHSRLELMIFDSTATDKKAYAYLYRSATITEPVPTPYEFQYDLEQDRIDTKQYAVALSKDNGVIKDILVKPPYGNGVDFFDTQKMRFSGVIDIGLPPINLVTDENIFYLYDYRKVTVKPIVRLVREVRETIRLGSEPMEEIAFYVTTKFYPFSGTVDGGEKLDVESLHEAFPEATDLYVYFRYVRQSWDFNAASAGMVFSSKRNQDLIIDGHVDAPDTTVTMPIREWSMASGNQGTFFTYIQFQDSVAKSVGLYYWDSIAGRPKDSTDYELMDTGDEVSYGDQGLYFRSVSSMRLGFTAYFLPASLQKSDGEMLAFNVANPVDKRGRLVDYPTAVEKKQDAKPEQFELAQNYPNPFNAGTAIRFYLPKQSLVSLRVLDLQGREVAQLLNGTISAGQHEILWNGCDCQNREVASGLYFYEIKTEREKVRKSMVLMR